MVSLKITTLVENHATDEGLGAEHGLSLLLEMFGDDGEVVSRHLFDTGQGDLFEKNAKVMNVDLSLIDSVIISHGHYDHAGGLDHFLRINTKATLFIKETALKPKYNGDRFIGFNHNSSLSEGRLNFVNSPAEVSPGLFLMPKIKIFNYSDTSFIKDDSFDDELYLVFNDGKCLTVISGCSHRGMTNIIRSAEEYFNLPVFNIIGGLHTRSASESRLQFISNELAGSNLKSASLCHCTGIDSYCYFKRNLKDIRISYNSCGSRLYIKN